MLIDAFPELKSLLQPAYRALYAVTLYLSNPHWSRVTRSEIRNPKSRGFTIIELVMVIILIGILAAYAAPKLAYISSMKSSAFTGKLRADIQYAQNLAMTRGQRSRVDFSVANQYTVQSSTTSTCSGFPTATDPATGGAYLVAINTGNYAGVTITPSMNCLEYNSLGKPFNCAGLGNVCAAVASGLTVTVNANAAAVGAITVSSQTGAVN